MRKYVFIFLIISLFSCKQSKEINVGPELKEIENAKANAAFMSQAKELYHTFPPFVQFILPEGRNASTSVLLDQQYEFISSSGLPTHWNMKDWMESENAARAQKLYTEHVKKNANHKYINVFKQYVAWILLTRSGLLEKDDKESLQFTKILTKDLVGSEYIGFGLLYYAFKHLKSHSSISETELGSFKIMVKNIHQAKAHKNNSDKASEFEQSRGKPLPKEMKEKMQQFESQLEAEQQKYLSLINSL